MNVRLLHGDCRDLLETLEAESVHSVVTDPPYHLTDAKRGGVGDASINLDMPHGRSRITAGFMNAKWDGGDVAFQPDTWRKVFRVMKPGAYLVAFGGTRTYHRLACAIEDAGFEIRDQLAWVYGSGFPKGTDKSKIPEAWQGFNTALKPAWEPIVLARKPMTGTLAANLEAHGAGAMNIDACRIAVESADDIHAKNPHTKGGFGHAGASVYGDSGGAPEYDPSKGRWPANLIHDGSAEVLEHFPETPGQKADAVLDPGARKTQNVYDTMSRGRAGEASADRRYAADGGTNFAMLPGARRNDEGSAARFFYCPKADREDRNDGGVQNIHPTVKPTDLMVWLCKLVTPPGGTILDLFMGSGSTGRGAVLGDFGFIGIEGEAAHVEISRRRIHAIAPLFVRTGT